MMKYVSRLGAMALLFLVIFTAINCEAQKTEKKALQSTIKRVDIPLDTIGSDSEPSLTRNIYFIFDGSGSMAARPDKYCKGDKRFKRKIAGAKWAVKEFIKKVPKDINIGLYVFDSRGTYEAVPLKPNNFDYFVQAVNKINPGGQTPLAQSIKIGTDRLIKQYKKQLGYGEFRLVVVTDGLANGIPEAAMYAAKYGIPIYAIGLCIGQNHPLRTWAVSYRAADNFQDLAKGLEETLAEMPAFDLTEFDK
jgi:Ca-activated chloride channel family protein